MSARKRAPGWVSWPAPTLVSVRLMPRRPALAGAYVAICWRSTYMASTIWSDLVSDSAAALPPGYQCTSTKSIFDPAIDSTVWFQEPGSPPAVMASGQLAGMVSTAPTLIVGSTAFIASEKATTPFAYVVALLSEWLSASQFAP